MSGALSPLLDGRAPEEQLALLATIRGEIGPRLRDAGMARITSLVPATRRIEWSGDTSSNDDGTVTSYASTLALVLRSGERIDLPVETDLDCGLDWYTMIDFAGFESDDAAEDFHDRIAALRPGCVEAEALALTQIGRCLGESVDVRALIGVMTLLAEEDPFGVAIDLQTETA
ncbi:MAG: hypothetical protein AB7F99_20660 [Vicinamibacterales bacterium]